MLLHHFVPFTELCNRMVARMLPDSLALAVAGVSKLIRPSDNAYRQALDSKYQAS
jgi:hypothetical protein